eukprot:403331296
MTNQFIHMISSGAVLYFLNVLIGNRIDSVLVNYLGTKRGYYAQIGFYVFGFFYMQSLLNNQKRLNINHLINPRDQNGEVALGLVLKYFPHKINIDLFRQIMMEKHENQLIRMNMYQEQMLQGPVDYIKLANPSAVQNYLQESQASNQQNVQQQMQSGFQMPQGMMNSGMMPQMPQFQQHNMQSQTPNDQNSINSQHHTVQEAHMQKILQDQQKAQLLQSKPQNQQTTSQTTSGINPINSPLSQDQVSNLTPEQQAEYKYLENARKRIIDQMREHQQQSPYLSTNKEIAKPTQQVQEQIQKNQSPYFLLQYAGHYSNIAQQAKKDSS